MVIKIWGYSGIILCKYYGMEFFDFDSDNEFIFSYGFFILNIISFKICYVEFLKVVIFLILLLLFDDLLFELECIL